MLAVLKSIHISDVFCKKQTNKQKTSSFRLPGRLALTLMVVRLHWAMHKNIHVVLTESIFFPRAAWSPFPKHTEEEQKTWQLQERCGQHF